MTRRPRLRPVALAAGAALGGALGALYVRFRRETAGAAERLAARSRLVDTVCGPVEYAERGEGPAVLISHGSLGGHDQGLLVAEMMSGYRILSPSRFGYLRSPVLGDGSPDAQADVLAALLDALGVDRAAMVGASAGGPSALAFALRHPDRCWALGLVAALAFPPPNYGGLTRAIIELMFASDFAFWLITTLGRGAMLQSIGGTPKDWARVQREPDSMRVVAGMLSANPVSLRNPGLLNDLAHAWRLAEIDLSQVRVPALVVQGGLDQTVPLAHGDRLARGIPGASYLFIPEGGHLVPVTHKHLVVPAMNEFLRRHAPPAHSLDPVE
jgi:pimeloyl-ACP methyl ester carboxylesterase